MTVSLEIKDIPLERIRSGKSQARSSELEKNLDDLMQSMNKWGLIEPITVFLNDDGFYEVLAGQRRYSAAEKLKWKTIPAVIRPRPVDDFEAKALSLTENVTHNPMTMLDIKDACDMLLKRYGNTKDVAKAIGIKESFVKNYITVERLPHLLKEAVYDGSLSNDFNKATSFALKALDALRPDDSQEQEQVEDKKILEFARAIAKKQGARERMDLVEEAKKDPSRPLHEIEAKAITPKKHKPLKLLMDEEDHSRLESYAGKHGPSGSPEDAALNLIVDGLSRAGF